MSPDSGFQIYPFITLGESRACIPVKIHTFVFCKAFFSLSGFSIGSRRPKRDTKPFDGDFRGIPRSARYFNSYSASFNNLLCWLFLTAFDCLQNESVGEIALENSRHFAMPTPLVCTAKSRKWCLRNERRNSILITCQHSFLGGASDWLKFFSHAARPIKTTTQVWVVTRHQYGISELVSQTSFRQWWRREMSALFLERGED